MAIKDKLREYLKAQYPDQGPLSDDFSLLDSGLLDSMSLVKLISHLEDTFGIEIEDDELDPDNFETIDTIAAMVATKSKG